MEILAPAGNFEAFFAAIEKGADAVYVGIKGFSARAYARNFSLKELNFLVAFAHQKGRKVFVALNSLIKENEWPEITKIALALNQIKPDALIIQDLGIFWLFKNKFPHLPLHASTLMNCHNLTGVKKLAEMGFRRVVLARELTLDEITTIKKNTSVELEIFVHGALCFSYSGLCLASSYIGGQSSLRGRCRQPCRFLYQWGKEKGYFLSCGDLSALELIPQLQKLGITSVKIEGRMKSAEYVASVVEAYRLVRDASGDEKKSALEYAKSLILQAGGRKLTKGFFLGINPKDVINPKQPGAFGLYVGRVIRKEKGEIFLLPETEIQIGDRLRAQNESVGKGVSWKVKKLEKAGNLLKINAPEEIELGYLLFKTITPEIKIAKSDKKLKSKLKQLVAPIKFKPSSSKEKHLSQWIYTQGLKKSQKVSKKIIWWIRHEEIDYFLQHPLPSNSIPVLSLRFQIYPKLVSNFRKLLNKFPNIVLSLPPIILPQQLNFFKRAIVHLSNLGFQHWHLANIGHFLLLDRIKDLILSSDYTLNIANHLALRSLKSLGIRNLTLSLELDRETIRKIINYWSPQNLIIMVYTRPPLWTSRFSLKPFWQNASLVSPLGESFYPIIRDEITYILPETPISLGPYLKELQSLGISQFGIDLRHILRNKINKIVTKKGIFLPREYSFNYKRKWA